MEERREMETGNTLAAQGEITGGPPYYYASLDEFDFIKQMITFDFELVENQTIIRITEADAGTLVVGDWYDQEMKVFVPAADAPGTAGSTLDIWVYGDTHKRLRQYLNELGTGGGGTSDTPEEQLEKIKSVDGAGSGLDADLLDGKQADEFAAAGHIHTAAEVHARAEDWMPSASEVGAASADHTHDDRYYTEGEVDEKLAGKAETGHTHTAAEVHARPENWMPTAEEVGAVPTSRKINGKTLTGDVTLTAADISAAATNHSHDDRYFTEAEVTSQLAGKAGKSTAVTATLLASGWVGNAAPYTYELAVSGVTSTSNQEILPALNITQKQFETLQAINILDAGQAANKIMLKTFAEKPTIDLPIRVIKRGDA